MQHNSYENEYGRQVLQAIGGGRLSTLILNYPEAAGMMFRMFNKNYSIMEDMDRHQSLSGW